MNEELIRADIVDAIRFLKEVDALGLTCMERVTDAIEIAPMVWP